MSKNKQQMTEQTVAEDYKFVSIYNLDPNAATWNHFDTVTGFKTAASKLLSNNTHGQLLFIKGHPSPEWLSAINAKYQMDPEFFLRHLDSRL